MRWPGWAISYSTALLTASSVTSSSEVGSLPSRVSSPQTRASRRAVSGLGVRASTGCSGRSRAIRRAVPPRVVNTTIQAVDWASAALRAAATSASASMSSMPACSASIRLGHIGSFSTRSMIRLITPTDSSG